MQRFARDGVIEVEAEGVKTQTTDGIVAVAVLDVTANGATEVLEVHADLIFAAGVEFQLHERVVGVAAQGAIVRAGKLSAVVCRRRIGDVGLIVFEPAFDNTFFLAHFARHQSNIAAIGDNATPVVFENLLGFDGFGIDQKSGSVAIEAVHHVCRTFLARFPEIIVENGLHTELSLRGGHGKNADVLFNDNDLRILVYNLDKFALKLRARFVFRDFYDHAGAKFEIVLRHIFVIDAHAATGEDCFCLGAADAVETLHDKEKKRFGLFHFEDCKLWLARIVHRKRG